MPLDTKQRHPAYTAFSPSWALMRDAIAGEDVIKSKAEDYLPIKSGTAAMVDAAFRQIAYDAYKLRAEFPEIVAPTIRGSVGTMLAQAAQIELPSALEPLRERATVDGLTLEALHRRCAIELMSVGRYGLLPTVSADGAPYLAGYGAESIVNWDVPSPETGWLVLDESGMQRNVDTGAWENMEQFREAYVTDEGQYVEVVWTKQANGTYGAAEPVVAQMVPRSGQQRVLGFNPFVCIGTNDLSFEPDDVPLYGLARIAIRVYRMDADYTFALHMTSEPTPWANGFDNPADAVKNGNAPTTLGSSKLWILPANAQAGYLEFSGPGLEAQAKAIDESLKRAIVFGAQLFDAKKTAESGEALTVRLGNQHSTLKTIAMNSAAGIEKAMKNLAVWVGANPDEVVVKPNLDFADHTLTGQELTAVVAGWMSGGYSRHTLFYNLKRGSIVDPDRTLEEELADIEKEGGGLNDQGLAAADREAAEAAAEAAAKAKAEEDAKNPKPPVGVDAA
jgi:hypothetical protein